MITNALLLLVAVVGVVAVGILLAYLWASDPFKTALGSCLSSLAVLIGTLGVPDVQGKTDIAVDIGFASLNATGVAFSTATPVLLWVVAFVSIVVLVALFAVLIFLRGHTRTGGGKKRAGGVGADGGMGGPVF